MARPAPSAAPPPSVRPERPDRALRAGLGDAFRPERRRTRVVRVGDVAIGGDQPIRIQSMTNTDTMDTRATVEQIARLAEAGCEIVRVTAPSIREAENLRAIRDQLKSRGIEVPLVADIHFTPNAALIAAETVEKVRINPGNYADKKKFEIREYDDRQYQAEIERVAQRFRPLVLRCKENGVAMRIGTNHGSLSDRILNRFGDTAEGMVESALEFLDVCEAENYYDIVFSMKASNTQVAIQAYRLLAARLELRSPGAASYPFHVGVTEAGDAEDGRIKSAIGIGSLLEDGLGDTIRVSLTEDPVREVPVAREIAERAARVATARAARAALDPPIAVSSPPIPDPFAHVRRPTHRIEWAGLSLGADEPVRVELEIEDALAAPGEVAARLALDLSALRDVECESLLVRVEDREQAERVGALRSELRSVGLDLPVSLRVPLGDASLLSALGQPGAAARGLGRWVMSVDRDAGPTDLAQGCGAAAQAGVALEWELCGPDFEIPMLVERVLAAQSAAAPSAPPVAPSIAPPVALGLPAAASLHAYRVLAAALADRAAGEHPIVLRGRVDALDAAAPVGSPGLLTRSASASAARTGVNAPRTGLPEAALIDVSVRLGSLLCDGIGDVVSLCSTVGGAPVVDLAYRVLQGARQRTTRTEYISCPSCGRTLFDLEETTARIKARTDHLKGVKIAVMGCIVNGPGEMADADFGYVGSGVGQVTLYVGQQIVARAVPEAEATDRLVELIREHGQWVARTDEAAG